MLELIKDFLHDRTTATTWIRAAAGVVGMYIMGHESDFPNWAEVLAAVVTGGSLLTTGQSREVKSDRVSREKEQP